MDLLTIILIAVGLAMDCFAVSVTKGLLSGKTPQWLPALLMALMFGLFQGGMPLLSYYAGSSFVGFFSNWSHWVALLLLGAIGGKMIYDSLSPKHNEEEMVCKPVFSFIQTLVLSVATSIDALVTGVLFVPVPEKVFLAVGIIALVSFIFSLAGYSVGIYVGRRFRFNAELMGGIILLCIGLKIFIEHYIN